MSSPVTKSFFYEYPRNGYLDKINPEFEGMAKKYYQHKKEKEKIEEVKIKLDKEVAFMERMERKVKQHLSKQKLKLKYTLEVKDRMETDEKRKEWMNEMLENQRRISQQKAHYLRSQTSKRLRKARQGLSEQKRSVASMTRQEKEKIKELNLLKHSQYQDENKNRVQQIEHFKTQAKEVYNKFFKSKTNKTIKSYKSRIISFKKNQQQDANIISSLEDRLQSLKQKYTKIYQKAQVITNKIEEVKQQSQLERSLIKTSNQSRQSNSSFSSCSKRSRRQIKKKQKMAAL